MAAPRARPETRRYFKRLHTDRTTQCPYRLQLREKRSSNLSLARARAPHTAESAFRIVVDPHRFVSILLLIMGAECHSLRPRRSSSTNDHPRHLSSSVRTSSNARGMLAALHRLAPDPARGRPLLPRLDESARALDDAYHFLSAASRRRAGSRVRRLAARQPSRRPGSGPRGPPGSAAQVLPRAAEAGRRAVRGLPARLLLARELIAHTAGRFDLETLVDFVVAYQRGVAARRSARSGRSRSCCGSRWSRSCAGSPTASSRRAAAASRRARWDAALARPAHWTARRIIDGCCATAASEDGRLSAAFVVELLQWLRDQPSTAAPAWQALQRALEAQDDSPDEMLRRRAPARGRRPARDRQHHHAACGCCRRSTGRSSSSASAWSSRSCATIRRARTRGWTSRRAIATGTRSSSWPSGAQAAGDRRSRDARSTLARAARQHDPDARPPPSRRLLPDLARPLRPRAAISAIRRRCASGSPASSSGTRRSATSGTIAVTIALGVASLLAYARRHGATRAELLAGRRWSSLLPVSELAISLLNLIVTSQVPPRQLPKLDMRGGIPAGDRTMVVVPAIIDSEARARSRCSTTSRSASSPTAIAHLHFALLTDFRRRRRSARRRRTTRCSSTPRDADRRS